VIRLAAAAAPFQIGDVAGWVVAIVVALITGGGGAFLFTRNRENRKVEVDAFTALSDAASSRATDDATMRGDLVTLTTKVIELGAALGQLRVDKDREIQDLRDQLAELRRTNEAQTREVNEFKEAVRTMVAELRLQWGRGGAFPIIVTKNNHLLEIVNPPDGG
jgi:uncharacterized protein HemX